MSKQKKDLLNQDISSRMHLEKGYVQEPPENKSSTGKGLNVAISVTIAIVVLAGILFPLLNIFQW